MFQAEARRTAWALLLTAPLLMGVTCGITDVDVEEKTLTVDLQGDQAVPPVETSGTGQVTARLFGNNLALQGNFSELPSPVLAGDEAAVIFGLGEPGEAGTAINAAPASSLDGRTGSFTLETLIDDELVEIFLNGGTYVELRTEDHPAGELRAQLR
ncbi:CHRD domain-containing protein [Vulgatibacter sp.]|uniref:CHRD domain-containing protein n=1 Tax=Vulgatibacter sp. TaxID=1971226 RepID=UPI0035671652